MTERAPMRPDQAGEVGPVATEPRLRRAMLIGLLGAGVGPSLTPLMHELEGARHGMHYVYRTVEVDDPRGVGELIDTARRLGFDGLNVTHPLKQAVVAVLDDLSATAREVVAVNTIVFTDAGVVGHNTDVTAFRSAFTESFPGVRPGHALLLGAGGGGAAVAAALAELGIDRLTVVDTDADRAAELARRIGARGDTRAGSAAPAEIPQLLPAVEAVVNATPVGMAAHPGSPVDPALLRPHHLVADIVYRPVRTPLLQAAERIGCRTMSGLGMAMHQAADAFEIFTATPADRAAMRADLEYLVAAEAAGQMPLRHTLGGERQ